MFIPAVKFQETINKEEFENSWLYKKFKKFSSISNYGLFRDIAFPACRNSSIWQTFIIQKTDDEYIVVRYSGPSSPNCISSDIQSFINENPDLFHC